MALPRSLKRTIAIGVDVALCALTVWLAYYIRLGEWVPMNGRPTLAIGLSTILAIPIFAAFGLYRIVFRHAGADAITSCAIACVVYGLGYAAFITAYGFEFIPRTIGLLQPVLLFIAVAASRSVAS
ncbi:MAG: polysaccharide biosynthesis protein, partial [Hymenobacter sp.]